MPLVSMGRRFTTSGGGGTTFDPSNTDSSLSLDGTDLICSMTGTTGNYSKSRSIGSFTTSQKIYFEMVCTTVGGNNWCIAIGNSLQQLGGGAYVNAVPAHAIGIYANGYSGATTFCSTFTTSDVVSCAVDVSANLAWFRVRNLSWMDAIGGSQDPATASGGVDISTATTAGLPLFAFLQLNETSAIGTGVFGSSGWTQGAPSGFTQI